MRLRARLSPRRGFGPAVALVLLVVVFPLVASGHVVTIGVFAGIFALPALGLSLLMGLAGQVSLGQAGFFAIGAYASAILTTRYGWNALLAALVAAAVTMAAGWVTGLPLLRLRGHYLALATLGFGIIVAVVANEWAFTGATSGIIGVPKPVFNGRRYDEAAEWFWLVWPLVAVALLLASNLVRSRVGRALAAVSDSEVAAETLGVDTMRLRRQVLVLSAGLASVGGSLYAHWIGVVNPAAASFLLSVRFLLMAVVGGLASVWGAVIGAATTEALNEWLITAIPRLLPSATGEVQLVGFGLVLAALMVLLPGGIVQAWRALRSRLSPPSPATAAQPPATPQAATPAGTREGTEVEIPAGDPATAPPPAPAGTGPLLGRDGRPPAGTAVLQVRNLSHRFGGVVAVDDVSLEVRTAEIVALIGPNGAGKTTLFNAVSGVLAPSSGEVTVRGVAITGPPHRAARARLARTFQNLQIFGSMTVLGNVLAGRYARTSAGIVAGALRLPARAEERTAEAEARRLCELLGLGDVVDQPAAGLPFGRQRVVELARALATEPDVLLLDEPMAGLSAAERAALVGILRRLRQGGMAILLVEHDIDLVMATADRVVVLDEGRVIASGPPAEVRRDPAVIAAYLGTDEEVARRAATELEAAAASGADTGEARP
jgi:branched-chain amino acid transport system permease protein